MISEGSNREKGMKRVATLYVKKLRNNATVPYRVIDGAGGYDLSSAEDLIISWKRKGVVKNELTIEILEDTYTRIAHGQDLL